jgi:crotonobetainyl-CoA:carnitine CoA-transferase CaiB-like acyl-CoA transferase
VEPAPDGDFSRAVSIYRNNRSLYFMQQNRGKQSLCVDLRNPQGLALVAELVSQVDVVVENFRPGIIDAMGLGYDRLVKLKSDIILCSISTFGQTGPLAKAPGYDFIAQAYSGITSMVGEPEQTPSVIGAALGDASTGIHAALGIVAAIHRRNRTGKGDHLDVAILDAYYSYHDANVHTVSGSGGSISPTRQGSHYAYVSPAGVFQACGSYVVIMGFMHHWPDLCHAMGREDLISDANFIDEPARIERRAELTAIIENWLSEFSDVAAAVKVLMEHDVPCAPVLSVAETLSDPHLRERGTVRTVEDPLHGPVDIPGMPIKWKHHPNNIPLAAPTLGQHNEQVLAERLGKSRQEIAALREAGVLVEKNS